METDGERPEIEIPKLLSAGVYDDKARFQFLDRPRREAAWGHGPGGQKARFRDPHHRMHDRVARLCTRGNSGERTYEDAADRYRLRDGNSSCLSGVRCCALPEWHLAKRSLRVL